jgi:hypothetical protein
MEVDWIDTVLPLWLSYLASAYAELNQFDDARRCITEATAAAETTKETWCEADIHRIAGEIVLMSSESGRSKGGTILQACA